MLRTDLYSNIWFVNKNPIFPIKKKKSIRELPYFLSNILVKVRIVCLLDCSLVLSQLKHKGVGAFLNPKK